jgi:hypothetical protein
LSGKKPQDREREEALIQLLDLQSANANRIGTDARDEFGNGYELKTTTQARISTARGVGINHLKKWRKLYWICSQGHYNDRGFQFTETYFLFPDRLEEWFSKIEASITTDDKLFKRVLNLLKRNGFTQAQRERVQRAFRRGVLLNDPRIPWSYIKARGIEICGNYAVALRKILMRRNWSKNVSNL